MVPKLVLFANLFGLFLVDAFLAADVRITQTLPASMAPGSEVRVNVTVEKGELSGFAKFQLDMPPGLSVTAIETKGASFTFADGKAKFIWMSLPPGPTFKFSYTLSADASARGALPIAGRLSYIEDNERKTHELPPITVDLGSGGTIAEGTATQNAGSLAAEENEETIDANDLVSAAGGATPPLSERIPMVVVDAAGIPPAQGPGGVSATRTITPVTDKEMLVEVIVKKGSIRGFGKLQETIPAGFTALEKTSDEAIFTAQERYVKFVWLNLPSREEVKVVYKLRATSQPDGEYTVDGEFGYLLNDETQKAVVGSSRFYIGPKALELINGDAAGITTIDGGDGKLDLTVKEKPVTKSSETSPTASSKTTPKATTTEPKSKAATTKPPVTAGTGRTIPAPEKGVVFKVQITAAHREVGKAYFMARHRYSGDFQIERHQGWIKYVTGRYGSYQEARDQRTGFVSAGHDFPGPFVTAYNNGERITVQEALMITKQQWVQ
ncbi:MAG: hypothetical protein R2817_07970 [Flavobacteriales bacterium]